MNQEMSVKCNENGNDEKKGWMAGSSGSGYTMDHRRPKTKDLRSGPSGHNGPFLCRAKG